jgi:hypothetical protein
MHRAAGWLTVSSLAAWLAVAGLPVAAQAPVAPSAPALRDITRITDLQTIFERDAGKIRIVLLLSPT